MVHRSVPIAVLVAGAAALAVLALTGSAGGAPAEDGVPGRGAAVFQARQCWSCHALAAAGSIGKSGPDLDRWLRPHAAQMRLEAADLAARRIAYGGVGMPAYVRELSPAELADLVAFVVGHPVSVAVAGLSPVPSAPAPPPETNAGSATVARWVLRKRLRGTAARGAAVFARNGCLSCHRYLGAGRTRFRAPALTNGGPTRRTAAGTVAFLRSATSRPDSPMPAYGDLGATNLRALAAFLAASRPTSS